MLEQGVSAGGNIANVQQGLRTKLDQIIAVNQLQHFYPPQALQAVLNRLGTVDFKCVSTLKRRKCPACVTVDAGPRSCSLSLCSG